jgi:MFS family permease
MAHLLARAADGFLLMAINWTIYAITRSPLVLAAVVTAQTLPFLVLTLPAGFVTDRFPRAKIAVLAMAGRTAAAGLLVPAATAHEPAVPLLMLVALLSTIARVFFEPARQALLPALFSRQEMLVANSWINGVGQGVWLLATLPGGWVLAAYGLLTSAVIIGVLLGLALLLLFPVVHRPDHSSARARTFSPVHHLFQLGQSLRGKPLVRLSLKLFAVQHLLGRGMLHIGLPILAGWLGAGAAAVGLLYAASGLGMAVGSVVFSRVKPDLDEYSHGLTMMVGWFINGLGLIWVGASPSLLFAALGMMVIGIGWALIDAPMASLLQRTLPRRMLGAAFATLILAIWLGETFAGPVFGVAFQIIDTPAVFVVSGLTLTALTGFGLVRLLGLRRLSLAGPP